MKKNPISNWFRKERDNTDKSLVAERDKANQTLKKANFTSQGNTDEIVKDERIIADQKTADSRAKYDWRQARSGTIAETNAVRDLLNRERQRMDIATESERAVVDQAIFQERIMANMLVNEVLELERKATDTNLQVERLHTDTGFEDSSRLLETEVANHLVTQTSLTTRDEFLAIVSHDLKNPVGAISSYAELLLDDTEAEIPLSPTAKNYVKAIQRNADASLRLISDLLDVEKISQGMIELQIKPVCASEMIREAIERFQLQAIERSIQLLVAENETSTIVNCDRDRILQVLGNLVGNAMKFTPAGGEIIIGFTQGEGVICFSVKDTGPGIAESKKDKIFERFAQLKSLNRQGLGLGLYISKTLVELHGGRIWVESVLSRGSQFYFCLPNFLSN